MINEAETLLNQPLHIQTSLVKCEDLSKRNKHNIWLKLENTQVSGSYKMRGIGGMIQWAIKEGYTELVSSSGGNAGIASSTAAKKLNIPITVVVPETTAAFMVDKIRALANNVILWGQDWDTANEKAIELVEEKKKSGIKALLIPPFDNKEIWAGHSTIVNEMHEQMKGVVPDLIVLSIGGGGLFSGLMQGMYRYDWKSVPILAMETDGTASFKACIDSGKWIAIDKIDSIAKTLGCKKICHQAFEWIGTHKKITSKTVSDKVAVQACFDFSKSDRYMVSPSCGAALAPLYDGTIADLQSKGVLPKDRTLNVIVIVCGGNEVNFDEMASWKVKFGIQS